MDRLWTIPNVVSLFRLCAVPGLVALAWVARETAFLWLLTVSLLSDALDGFLARVLDQPSDTGARLDSWADLSTWLALPICGWWLRPDALHAELPWLCAGLACYLLSVVVGWWKFRCLVAYHTWSGKTLSLLAAVAVLVFFAGGPSWVLRALMPLVVVSSVEEILITLALNRPLTNVPTVWHAWRLRLQCASAHGSYQPSLPATSRPGMPPAKDESHCNCPL
ncbi:MAG: CDP-alcohol phosphatidyltransferase family protein [Verrucomicrobiota bacterium]|nr:CDP-alcohol phosphatidyltransferase family protein [Limisphaera sp.]MDW8382038.1 CDP-alcohol phosphatidyltransferase family protein [Verrucomicrobiota bacterium]